MQNKTTYIMIDTSGSMRDCPTHSRSSAVNQAMREVMEEILPRVLAEKDSEVVPYIAVLLFSGRSIEWHIPRTKMEDVSGNWLDIELSKFDGGTPTGEAIKTVIDDITNGCNGEPDPDAVAPAFLLISDGMPNGSNPTYEEALGYADKNNPNYSPAFRHSNRIAIGIQVDASGRDSLKKFGRVSNSVEAQGFDSYYDCTDSKRTALVEIIKSCTFALSVASSS